jgi:hypothetical protein
MLIEILLLMISSLFWLFSIGLIAGVPCSDWDDHSIMGKVIFVLSLIGIIYSLYLIGFEGLTLLGVI